MIDRLSLLSVLGMAAVFVPLVSTPVHAADLTVSFKFGSFRKCSRVSPEIMIGNIPRGARTYFFTVKAVDAKGDVLAEGEKLVFPPGGRADRCRD